MAFSRMKVSWRLAWGEHDVVALVVVVVVLVLLLLLLVGVSGSTKDEAGTILKECGVGDKVDRSLLNSVLVANGVENTCVYGLFLGVCRGVRLAQLSAIVKTESVRHKAIRCDFC